MRLLPGWLAAQEGRTFALDGDASIRRRPVDRIAEPLARMGARHRADRRPLPAVRRARHGAARDLLRAAGRERAGEVVRADRRACAPRARRPSPSRRRAATTPSGCSPAPASRCARDGVDVSLARAAALAGAGPDRARRPLLGGVHDRRRRCSSAARACSCATSASTGRASASCGSSSGWARGSAASSSRFRRRAPRSRSSEPICDLDVARRAAARDGRRGRRGPAGDRRAAARRAARLLRRGRDGRPRRAGAAREGVRPHRRRRRRPARPRRDDRGDRGRLRGDGRRRRALRGGTIDARGDHRMAMLGAVAGLASREGVRVVGMEAAAVSYPGFVEDLGGLR